LAKDPRYFVISTGGLLRAEVQKGSELGNQVKQAVESQTLVSDDIIWTLVNTELQKVQNRQFVIFEGFPRSVEQAEKLGSLVTLQKAISVRVPQELGIRRMSAKGWSKEQTQTHWTQWLQQFEPLLNWYKTHNKLR